MIDPQQFRLATATWVGVLVHFRLSRASRNAPPLPIPYVAVMTEDAEQSDDLSSAVMRLKGKQGWTADLYLNGLLDFISLDSVRK